MNFTRGSTARMVSKKTCSRGPLGLITLASSIAARFSNGRSPRGRWHGGWRSSARHPELRPSSPPRPDSHRAWCLPEHFYYIAAAMNRSGRARGGNEEEGSHDHVLRPLTAAPRLGAFRQDPCAVCQLVIGRSRSGSDPESEANVQSAPRRIPEFSPTMHRRTGHPGVAERGSWPLSTGVAPAFLLVKMPRENEFPDQWHPLDLEAE
jgi:hypothetical protein